MRIEPVEIYSDRTNSAVMRHPGRTFPGVVVQGGNLYAMCQRADEICAKARSALDDRSFAELDTLRNSLWGYLNHYKSVVLEHGWKLPFVER